MAEFHFVEDYERLVARLLSEYPEDEAMSRAVGGAYGHIGAIESDILVHAGLEDGMSVIDLGCGSGRLATALSERAFDIDYLGIDIVQSLLDYAAKKAPRYRFVLHRELSLPAANSSADIVSAFSVFTHLLHHETYIYMEDARRVLKPGGKLVFSFLEFEAAAHWDIFVDTIDAQRHNRTPHLNSFIERDVIRRWAQRLNYGAPVFHDAGQVPGSTPLGQSVAILLAQG
jgi:ubiquinone/menaquinone biosynthesis C-methylase UbiE